MSAHLAIVFALVALALVQGAALVTLASRLRGARRLLAAMGGELERKLHTRKALRLIRNAGERAAGNVYRERVAASAARGGRNVKSA